MCAYLVNSTYILQIRFKVDQYNSDKSDFVTALAKFEIIERNPDNLFIKCFINVQILS